MTNGIPACMLDTLPLQQIDNIRGLLPPVAADSSGRRLRDALLEEVKADYDFSLRRSIGKEQVHSWFTDDVCNSPRRPQRYTDADCRANCVLLYTHDLNTVTQAVSRCQLISPLVWAGSFPRPSCGLESTG